MCVINAFWSMFQAFSHHFFPDIFFFLPQRRRRLSRSLEFCGLKDPAEQSRSDRSGAKRSEAKSLVFISEARAAFSRHKTHTCTKWQAQPPTRLGSDSVHFDEIFFFFVFCTVSFAKQLKSKREHRCILRFRSEYVIHDNNN